MKMFPFPFTTTDWQEIMATEHPGETGMAYWRTQYFGEADQRIRVRKVEYSAGYLADHWCDKGHVLFCLQGELTTRLQDGREFKLSAGMSYQVGDGVDAHQSYTAPCPDTVWTYWLKQAICCPTDFTTASSCSHMSKNPHASSGGLSI